MNCNQAREYLHKLLDGELEGARRPGLDEHLGRCEDCRSLWAQLQALDGGLAWLSAASESFGATTMAPPRRAIRGLWMVPAAAAALVVLAAGLRLMLAPVADERLVPPTMVSAPAVEAAPFEFELAGQSHDRYIAVLQPSTRPRVHVVWLYLADPDPPESKERVS